MHARPRAIKGQEPIVFDALRRHVPEAVATPWLLVLLALDVVCVLAACYAAGLPPEVGPAACVLICGAFALVGIYHQSYAVVWWDEAYHALVGMIVAAVPVWAVLHFVTGLPSGQLWFAVGLCALFVCALHCALARARHGNERRAYAGATLVRPQAQWNVGRSPYRALKRVMDLVLGSIALVLLSPLMAIAAVAILIDSGLPVFFRQQRIGRSGKPFWIYKFRTMRNGAGTTWARPQDSRITRLGALLRRSSIDELPQLFNVLLGDMSLVGPRPEMREFAHEFARTLPHYDERHITRPGITGWAQVQLKRNLQPGDMPDVVAYDLFYVEYASATLDAIVILKTAAEFLFHRAV